MKIITKKQEEKRQKEMDVMKHQNDFFMYGVRAMSRCIDYQRAIVAILETANIKEIEIDNGLLYTNNKEIQVENTPNNTTKIRITEERRGEYE